MGQIRENTPLVAIKRVELVKHGALLTISSAAAFYKDLACSSMGLAHTVPSVIFFVLAQIASATINLSTLKHTTSPKAFRIMFLTTVAVGGRDALVCCTAITDATTHCDHSLVQIRSLT